METFDENFQLTKKEETNGASDSLPPPPPPLLYSYPCLPTEYNGYTCI